MLCNKCEEKKAVWKVPFLYCDMNDKLMPDLGQGYRQYFCCEKCKQKEERILASQGKDDWNERWEKIEDIGLD